MYIEYLNNFVLIKIYISSFNFLKINVKIQLIFCIAL